MPRILIIDDERSIRSTLREILEYEQYEVDEAQDLLKPPLMQPNWVHLILYPNRWI